MPASNDFISGEHTLNRYIHDFEENEKKACVSMSIEETSNSFSFWSNSNMRNLSEVSPLLRRCTYQLSSITPGTKIKLKNFKEKVINGSSY